MFGVERPSGEPAEEEGGAGGAAVNGAGTPEHPKEHPKGHPNGAAKQAGDSADADRKVGPDGDSGSAGSNGGTRVESGHKPSRRAIAIGAAAVCLAGAGVGYAISQAGGPASSTRSSSGAPVASGPIRVVSVTPAAGASKVDGANPVTVTFNEPVAANTPDPVLRPSVPGTWAVQGDSLVFTPAKAFAPSSRETIQIPAGAAGVRSAGGRPVGKPMTEHFTTGAYSQARLAQLLGQLGYLPLRFSAQVAGVGRIEVPESGVVQQSTSQQALAFNPPVGSFTWTQVYPSTLTSLWSSGGANVILRGAVMAFQSEHGMTINGALTPKLWNALFLAAQGGDRNKNGYTYVLVSKGSPETLTVYHDGRQVLRTLANTGIPVSPTVDGTFPVYLRLRNQIMSGTNPDGSHYADPVSFVAYFNGGDAIHYFPRGSFGFPQSLGCVELPYNQAQQVFPFTTYGSLVTVAG